MESDDSDRSRSSLNDRNEYDLGLRQTDRPVQNDDDSKAEDENGSPNSKDNTIPGVKSCLTGRNKKKVIINEVQRSVDIINIRNKINNLENSFKSGINDILQAVDVLEEEKRSMELHVKALEDSLKYCNTNNDEYEAVNEQLKMEVSELKESLQKLKATNKLLLEDNESIQSEHTEHIQSIADKQRQNRVARRSFEKWKKKLMKKDMNLNLLLQTENRKLKDELIKYQEDAKQAFLRSAKTLNSEALSMFQNSNNRLLQYDYLIGLSDHVAEEQEDSQSFTSESSGQTYTNIRDDNKTQNDGEISNEKIGKPFFPHDKIFFQRISKQKNSQIYPQSTADFLKKFGNEEENHTIQGRSEAVGIKDRIYDKIRLESRGEWIEPNPVETSPERISGSPHRRRASGRSYIADYVPDALRRETRQIMTQLQKSKNQNLIDSASNSLNACDMRNHLHICHCVPQTGKSVNCQYCTSKQNFNFSKMPLGTRPECKIVQKRQVCQINNDGNYKKSRNVVIKSLTPSKENKSKVIYQPSSSAFVVEKHIK